MCVSAQGNVACKLVVHTCMAENAYGVFVRRGMRRAQCQLVRTGPGETNDVPVAGTDVGHLSARNFACIGIHASHAASLRPTSSVGCSEPRYALDSTAGAARRLDPDGGRRGARCTYSEHGAWVSMSSRRAAASVRAGNRTHSSPFVFASMGLRGRAWCAPYRLHLLASGHVCQWAGKRRKDVHLQPPEACTRRAGLSSAAGVESRGPGGPRGHIDARRANGIALSHSYQVALH